MIDIISFFKNDIIRLEKESNLSEYRLGTFLYPAVFEDMAREREEKYIKIFNNIKNRIEKIIKDAERGYDKTATILLNDNDKESIALAILGMRNELLNDNNSNINLIGDSYKSGHTIPQKVIGYQLTEEDIVGNKRVIESLREEFIGDIDRFIEDFSNKIDNISDDYDNKVKNGSLWTWSALLLLLLNVHKSLYYRLSLISKEPFRKAYRKGMIHGAEKIVEKQGMEIVSILWETTGTNPCENCQSLDGQEISLKEAESFLHPNCACTLRIIVREIFI
jgi:hypothetical protein